MADTLAGKNPMRPAGDVPPLDLGPPLQDGALTDEEPTVRDVMRSLLNVHRQKRATPRRPAAAEQTTAEANEDGADDPEFDLRRFLLDNQTIAGALRAVIEPLPAEDGERRFSILGLGQFSLDTTEDGRALTISETGAKLSVTVPWGHDAGAREMWEGDDPGRASRSAARNDEETRRLIVARILAFLTSPFGILTEIVAGWLLLFYAVIKVLKALRAHQ